MSQATQPVTVARTVALIAHASGSFVNLWAGEDEMFVATDDEGIGSWAVQAVLDEKNEAVPMRGPNAQGWLASAHKLADAFLPKGDEDAEVVAAAAVHLVVRVQRRDIDGDVVAVVWAPSGRVLNAHGAAELGRVIKEVATDDSEPKVPAGPPPDAGRDLFDRVARGVAAASGGGGG